eukprot:CAMPEP_0201285520 /NCGR_PEP_ID=MMETSP1317-20130820/110312_1 /ASSEMBLY_ACC=CAM_ASM_000770 /TAXON_ID=187299 /ORGANISM="Undescribed Undescribed, Strain Undescribed" /LENGTH=56 /DNA_ID=CAMNT_0047610717 /DNA_START=88 /DNA_END=255 /DNA_ORIENTATION=-
MTTQLACDTRDIQAEEVRLPSHGLNKTECENVGKFTCCSAPVLPCIRPKSTVGLGD